MNPYCGKAVCHPLPHSSPPPLAIRFCRALLILSALLAANLLAQEIRPVPDELRRELKLEQFYQKYTAAGALPVLASTNTSDYALREAAWIIRHVLAGREDLVQIMASNHVRITVMAWNEFTTDVPEHRDLKPAVFWDRRARGLGGAVVSCGEENLLCYPGDPYSTENLLIHEFGHAIHGHGLKAIDPTFNQRLRTAYQNARERGLWKGTYAGQNAGEYWAEAVQDWFDNNRENDSLHNHVNTRAELKEYDPDLARLCAEVFGENPWRYHKPTERPPAERAHLAGFDTARAPRFRWREALVPELPRVLIQTELGEIEVELFRKEAPLTVTNFLRYVHEGFYADGAFTRAVTASNQPTNLVKVEVVQAKANPAKEREFFPPIALERTRDTGLRHLDGTISMARLEPDTARHSFFICVGDQPELDYGGRRNPDGQGFAAFGKVVKGMDVVRKIHASVAEGQNLTPPIRIQRAIRLN